MSDILKSRRFFVRCVPASEETCAVCFQHRTVRAWDAMEAILIFRVIVGRQQRRPMHERHSVSFTADPVKRKGEK